MKKPKHMKKPKQLLVVFDNGWSDEDEEKYTIVLKDGDVYKCSSLKVFDSGKFHHNIVDSRLFVVWGSGWRDSLNVKKCTKYSINKFLNDIDVIKEIGNKIDWSLLPKEVQQYILKVCNPTAEEFK